MKVGVLGAGVAGTFLAYFLSLRGIDVEVYEARPSYDFPCGEAVPGQIAGYVDVSDYVVTDIRRLTICVAGIDCRSHDFGRTMGWIIRKHDFVNDYRGLARIIPRRASIKELNNGRYDVIVDARGPFSDVEEYDALGVVRGFTNARPKHAEFGEIEIDEETLYMYFDPRILGYYWIFPSANDKYKWNVGFGAVRGIPVKQWFAVFNELHGISNIEVHGIRGKKIKLADPGRAAKRTHYRSWVYAVGEAGGFIVPLTGEGIRPAIESAWSLAIELAGSHGEFDKVIKVYEKHHKLYRLMRRLGPAKASKVLLKLSANELETLLSGNNINLPMLARMLLYML